MVLPVVLEMSSSFAESLTRVVKLVMEVWREWRAVGTRGVALVAGTTSLGSRGCGCGVVEAAGGGRKSFATRCWTADECARGPPLVSGRLDMEGWHSQA